MSTQRRVRIPADTDRPDALIAGLSPRQVVIASGAVLLSAVIYESLRAWLPTALIAVVLVPPVAAASILVFGHADGVSADRLALAALRHASSPAAYVSKSPGEEDSSKTRSVSSPTARRATKRLLPASPLTRVKGEIATLCPPVQAVTPEGIVDLAADGSALLACASTVNFSLYSAPEQEAAVSSFANLLNGLEGAVSFHLSFAPVDVTDWLADFDAQDGRPARTQLLGAAARAHRSFVSSQAHSAKSASRRLVVVFTCCATAEHACDILSRRLEEAAEAVSHLGIHLIRLDANEAMHAIASSCPPSPNGAPNGAGITSGDPESSWVRRAPSDGEPPQPHEPRQ